MVLNDDNTLVILSNRLSEMGAPLLEQGMIVGQLTLADALIIGNCNNQVGSCVGTLKMSQKGHVFGGQYWNIWETYLSLKEGRPQGSRAAISWRWLYSLERHLLASLHISSGRKKNILDQRFFDHTLAYPNNLHIKISRRMSTFTSSEICQPGFCRISSAPSFLQECQWRLCEKLVIGTSKDAGGTFWGTVESSDIIWQSAHIRLLLSHD